MPGIAVFVVGSEFRCGSRGNLLIFFFKFFMVFPVLPEFSMAVNKQVKGSEIFNKSETSKDKGKETGKKQGVDESVHKKRTVTENKIENSNDSSN